jgi:phosphatidylglycerol:prolipoprotein diacylglycerol transferase
MYGGIIAGLIFVLIWTKKKKISLGALLDLNGVGLILAQSIGRWGNFMNREAFGVETDIFCRMGLTNPGQATIYVHPTFLYESLWTLCGFIFLHNWSKKEGNRKYDGQLFMMYVMWYGLGRSWIEGLRTDSLWLIPGVIRVSQMVAGVSALIMAAILIVQSRRPHQPEKLFVNRVPCSVQAENSSQPSPAAENTSGADKTIKEETDIHKEDNDNV